MMHTGKTRGWQSLMALALLASPALAQVKSAPPSESEKLDAIQKSIKDLKATVESVKDALGGLPDALRDMKDLHAQRDLVAQRDKTQLNDIAEQIRQLKDEIESLRNRVSNLTRVAAYPPAGPYGAPPSDGGAIARTSLGRVEMINTYPTEMSVVLNGRTYRLQPGERRLSDPIPAGTFTYEVLGVTPQYTRTLTPDQIFTIHVHPQG